MTKGRFVALAIAAFVATASPVHADDAHPWDATWAGGFADGGDGVQLIIVGDEVIGFFFHGDYIDVTGADPLAPDKSLSFRFDGGSATLSVDGSKRIVTIRQDGATARVIELKKDD